MLSTTSNGYTRKPELISKLFSVSKDITTVTDDVTVVFPTRFINKKLADIGSVVNVVSVYAIIDNNNNYAIVAVPIFQTLCPNNIEDIKIDGVEHKALRFAKDSVFLATNKLIISDSFLYNIFDEFFIQGNVPWYLGYRDTSDLLSESKKYANNNIGEDPIPFEILTSAIARDPSKHDTYLRKTITNIDSKVNPVYVGLNNRFLSYDNTGSKLLGGYFSDGIMTSIVEQETKTSDVSDILRH